MTAPKAFFSSFPVTFTPSSGSATVRVKTALMGVEKKSAPSRKNGRFSGKKSANRSFSASCAASASTWEKSGFTAAETVTLGVIPHRMERPGSTLASPALSGPSGKSARSAVWCAVIVGSSSRLRPGRRSRNPVSLSNWQMRQGAPRSVGIVRMRCRSSRGQSRDAMNPQVWTPEPRGNRSCVNGMAISTM